MPLINTFSCSRNHNSQPRLPESILVVAGDVFFVSTDAGTGPGAPCHCHQIARDRESAKMVWTEDSYEFDSKDK